ncbi:hypothetical protein [Arthrobacter sp. D1-17]
MGVFHPDADSAVDLADEIATIRRDGGEVVYDARINGTTFQTWSPLQKGFQEGVFVGSPDYLVLHAELHRRANKYQVTLKAITVAWITSHRGMQGLCPEPRSRSASPTLRRPSDMRCPAARGTA